MCWGCEEWREGLANIWTVVCSLGLGFANPRWGLPFILGRAGSYPTPEYVVLENK